MRTRIPGGFAEKRPIKAAPIAIVRQAWRVARNSNHLAVVVIADDSEVNVLYTFKGEVSARGKGVAGNCESEGHPRQMLA